MHHSPLNDVLILLGLSVVAVALLRRLHLPPILGYLLVGIIAGPYALGWVPHGEAIELLAEVGVVFLLFMIGLELSVAQMLAIKGVVLGLGGAQMLLTTAVATGIAWLAGLHWQGALVIGGAVALSSTAIAARLLTEQLEIHSRHGRVALGILLFQDLAVVPFLVLIPILGDGGQSLLAPLGIALGKALIAFVVMFAVGHWLLRPLFHTVAAARSVELFTLAILLVALAAAAITDALGLSLALGAFLAGMMLGETEYRHQVETEVRPFRDVLLGLFFITVGTRLDLGVLPEIGHWVLLLLVLLVLGKGLLVALVARLGGYETGVAVRAGAVLAQGGEFGFALLTLALSKGLLSDQQAQPVLAVLVFSMALAPILIRYNGRLAKRLCSGYLHGRQRGSEHLEQASRELHGHVVICGFSRIGQNLASFLKEEGLAYVALDLDPALIREAWEAGEPVYYGDSSHSEILEGAGLARARALVVTFSDAHTGERIVRAARRVSDRVPIVARIHDDAAMETLERAGADEVVAESMEASMMLASHLLRRLDVPADEIERLVEKARQDHYRRLRGYFHGEDLDELAHVEEPDPYRLHTVVLSPGSHAAGRALGELDLGSPEVSVHAVRRGGIVGELPEPELVLAAGEAVVLQGPAELLEQAEERLLKG